MLSHNTASHNVVLKISVPRRTGRKRKRGSDQPFQSNIDMTESTAPDLSQSKAMSKSRLDHPTSLLRRLRDSAGKYSVEAIGVIPHTHRYRGIEIPLSDRSYNLTHRSGLADFQFTRGPFTAAFVDQVLPGDGRENCHFMKIPS